VDRCIPPQSIHLFKIDFTNGDRATDWTATIIAAGLRCDLVKRLVFGFFELFHISWKILFFLASTWQAFSEVLEKAEGK
jgi:hypothetical protein